MDEAGELDIQAADRPPPITGRQVTAAVIGNALEFYDFTTYAFFAVQIGEAFFPKGSHFDSLMASLATFGAGFISRPFGAAVIGRFADRNGRRPAMLLSFGLMGLAILGLALTPSFAAIGWIAPLIVLGFRLLQGFALGGEVGPTTAFLIEAAPAAKRGLLGSWQSASQGFSSLIAGLIGLGLTHLFDAKGLVDWGWRIAFLIGALVLPFGLMIRRSLPETLHHTEEASSARPAEAHLAGHTRIILIGLAVVASVTISTYCFNYMTTYALTTLHLPAGISFEASIANGTVGVLFTLLGGFLSDRFGRKALMLIPRLAFLAGLYPAFSWMVRDHTGVALLTGTAVLGALSSMSSGVSVVCLTESLHKDVRSLLMASVYSLAVAAFGGTTQLTIHWLIETTGSPLAPAFYMMVATSVGLVAMALMRETAPIRVGRVDTVSPAVAR